MYTCKCTSRGSPHPVVLPRLLLVARVPSSQPSVHPSARVLHPTVEVPLQRVGCLAPVRVGVVNVTVRAAVGKDPLHIRKEEPARCVVTDGQLL